MTTYNLEQQINYQKIDRFFVEQISQLAVPVIDARPNCVSVGPYRVITNGNQFEVWKGRSQLHNFHKRNCGVGYAVCLYNGDNKNAQTLKELDLQYSRLANDQGLYKYHINNLKQQNNSDRSLVFENRLSRVESELMSIEDRIISILKSFRFG